MGAPVDQQRYGSKAVTTTTTTTTTTAAASESNSSKNLLAERFKTKICQNFEKTGSCPYEVRCMFAHGLEDLRTTEMNFRDRLTSDDAIKSYQRSRLIAARQAKKRAKVAAQQLAEACEQATAQAEQHLKPPQPAAVPDGGRSPSSELIAVEYLQVTQPPSPAGLHEHPGELASMHDLLASQQNNALSMSSVLQPCAGEASLTSFVDHNFLTAPHALPPARTGSKSPTTANLASSTLSVDSALSRSSRRFRHDPYNQQPLGMSGRRSLTPSHLPQLSVEDIKIQAEHDAVSQSSTPQCERCLSTRRGSLASAGSFVKPVSPLAAAMMAKRSNNATPDSWFEEPSQPNFCFEQKSSGQFEPARHL